MYNQFELKRFNIHNFVWLWQTVIIAHNDPRVACVHLNYKQKKCVEKEL